MTLQVATEHVKRGQSELRCVVSAKYTVDLKIEYEKKV